MGKNRNKYIKWLGAAANVIVVVYFLFISGAVAVVNPARPTVSEIEKRELAKKPEFSLEALAKGSYTSELSAYFADTFPFRDSLIQIGSAVKDHLGFRPDGIRLYGAAGDAVTAGEAAQSSLPLPEPPAAESASQPAEAAKQPTDGGGLSLPAEQSEGAQPPAAQEGTASSSVQAPAGVEPSAGQHAEMRGGSILTYDGAGYSLFGGSEGTGSWYAQVISAYGDILGDSMRVYNMVVPTAVEFNLPQRYRSMSVSQRDRLDNIRDSLGDKVEWVDIYDELSAHKDEYLFFRTDHHWTSLGAYYAYRSFAVQAGFEPVPLESLEKRTLNGFLGTLYSQTQDSRMTENPDHVDYYIFPEMPVCHLYRPDAPYTALRTTLYGEYAQSYNSYSVFMHGDFPVFMMDTGLDNGRRIAVVKESYGNALVPFLAANYEKVLVIDQRYLQRGLYQLLEENGINELLFINNILAAHTAVRIQELSSLPVRSYTPPPPPPLEEADAAGQAAAQDASAVDAAQQAENN